MLKMFVTNVGVSARTGLPIVVLRDDDDNRLLAITIGQQEAVNITRAMSRLNPPRPRPLDVLMNFAKSTGYALKEVLIDFLDEDTYRATITLWREDGHSQTLDARPSDALALAVSCAAPIFVAPELTMAVKEKKATIVRDEKFTAFLSTLRASDFSNLGISVSAPEDDEPAA